MSPSAALIAAVDDFFRNDPPDRLGVAVSGGSDSLGLLHLLNDRGGAALHVVTVDHGLRPEAGAEARHVGGIAAGLGLEHETLTWDGWRGEGNLQDQARRARYRLIGQWAEARGVATVALGHTRDDNVESFVMGLARGAGLDGLSGMRPRFRRGPVEFVRPLLGVGRDALRADLSERGVAWVNDPSNEDCGFERVRIRQALTSAGVAPETIARSIDNLRRTRRGLDAVLADWTLRHARVEAGDIVVGPDAFAALPEDLARRFLNAALRWVSGEDYPPRAPSVMRLVTAMAGPGGQTLHGCLVREEGRGFVIGREPEAALRAAPVETDAVWDGRWRLEGPHAPDLRIAALGDGLSACPGWRETGLRRVTLAASPAIWRGDALVAAPVAGLGNGWTASVPDAAAFAEALFHH